MWLCASWTSLDAPRCVAERYIRAFASYRYHRYLYDAKDRIPKAALTRGASTVECPRSPTPLPSDDPTPRSDSGSSDALNVGGAQPALAGRHTDACAPHPRPLLPLAERNGSFLGALTRATLRRQLPRPAAAPPPAPPPSPARI